MPVRKELIAKVWNNIDPYPGFQPGETDLQGWGSQHPYLAQAIKTINPAIVVEIGVWKGGSVVSMAKELKASQKDAVVIAVDTWLGAWDHWLHAKLFHMMGVKNGRPTLYDVFMTNICNEGLTDYVLPLPLDSANAAIVFEKKQISIDLLHIDAAHYYHAVALDLERWWPLLRPGGMLIGDDYTESVWPGVVKAINEFTDARNLPRVEHFGNKCRLIKPL